MVGCYYWRGVPNFGDLLSPLILAHFGIEVEWASPADADIFCVGSVLDLVPDSWSGYVLGSGKLRERSTPDVSLAKVLAVRGPFSAKGISGEFVFGDPGLLVDELVPLPEKRYALGIVPHWSDKELAGEWDDSNPDTLVINPRRDPLEVVSLIGSCKRIVSSSLHGLIVADAFGIPRRFEYTPQFDREGGLFKFRDYFASIDESFTIGKTRKASRRAVNMRKDDLRSAFRSLHDFLASPVSV